MNSFSHQQQQQQWSIMQQQNWQQWQTWQQQYQQWHLQYGDKVHYPYIKTMIYLNFLLQLF